MIKPLESREHPETGNVLTFLQAGLKETPQLSHDVKSEKVIQ